MTEDIPHQDRPVKGGLAHNQNQDGVFLFPSGEKKVAGEWKPVGSLAKDLVEQAVEKCKK